MQNETNNVYLIIDRKAKWRKQQKYLQSLHDIQNEIPSQEEHYEIHYEELPRHGSEFGIANDEPNSLPRKRQRGVRKE